MIKQYLQSSNNKKLAQILVVETERLIDHIGSEKNPRRIVQQWGILVNSLVGWTSNLEECITDKLYKILGRE